MNTQQKIIEVVEGIYLGVLNAKNYALLETLCDKEAVFYDGKNKFTGRDEIVKLITVRNEAIPDFHYEIKEIITDGEKAAVRWSATGEVKKDFSEFKAGDSAHYWGISTFHFKNGKIYRNYSNESITDSIPED